MPVKVSISDLLGTAAVAARVAAQCCENVRDGKWRDADDQRELVLEELRSAQVAAIQALSEISVARWEVEARHVSLEFRTFDFENGCTAVGELIREALAADES